jgi:hypothetical protein
MGFFVATRTPANCLIPASSLLLFCFPSSYRPCSQGDDFRSPVSPPEQAESGPWLVVLVPLWQMEQVLLWQVVRLLFWLVVQVPL